MQPGRSRQMPDISEIADGIYRFETPVPGMFYMPVVYVIRESESVLIEPGPGMAIPQIREALRQLKIEALSYIIPTHIHVDHGGGSGELAQLYPEARVVAHPRGAKHLISPSRLIESTKLVWGEDFEAVCGPFIPVPEDRILVPRDGETIALGGRELQILYAPGHAPHHLVILDRKLNALFCGEALGLPGHQLPTVAPYSFDQELYLSTIERLRQMDVDLLIYSHGGLETEPQKMISRAAENARNYADMILEALRNGQTTEQLMQTFADDVARRFGVSLEEKDVEIAVAGYSIYFKNKGLVP